MLKRYVILFILTIVIYASSMAQNDSIVEQKQHNPKRATIYSAVLPGLGQAYNKKYWKIPIVYAGIGTIYYFAHTNGESYRNYRDAFDYKSGINNDVNNEIIDIANKYSGENLISLRDYYRRNMELSWIIMALWYGINIIDACVDAHFFEYDIGDDLTLKVEPTIQTNFAHLGAVSESGNGYGISLKLKF